MKSRTILTILGLLLCNLTCHLYGQSPIDIVNSFGEGMSNWCSTKQIIYRQQVEQVCSGLKSCRVEDKILAENNQKTFSAPSYETYMLDSYLNLFQQHLKNGIKYSLSNIQELENDYDLDGNKIFFFSSQVTVSGSLNYNVHNLFLVVNNKIAGIYDYEGRRGFYHLNKDLIESIKTNKIDYLNPFCNGYSQVHISNKQGFGIIDKRGRFVIPCLYNYVNHDGGDYASVKSPDGEWCVYNLRTGKIIPGITDIEWYFKDNFDDNSTTTMQTVFEGLSVVKGTNGLYGFMDEHDKIVIPCKYDDATSFSEGLAYVEENGKKYYIDHSGKIVINVTGFVSCGPFMHGLAPIMNQNYKNGYINKECEVVIPFIYDEAKTFTKDGLAVVGMKKTDNAVSDYNYGYIDNKGSMITSFEYEMATPFFQGKGIAYKKVPLVVDNKDGLEITKKDRASYIDKQGHSSDIFGWKYGRLGPYIENKPLLVYYSYEDGGGINYCNHLGKEIFPKGYLEDGASFNEETLAAAVLSKETGKWGCIDINGVLIIPFIFDNKFWFEDGIATVTKDGKPGIIDTFGNSYFNFE